MIYNGLGDRKKLCAGSNAATNSATREWFF